MATVSTEQDASHLRRALELAEGGRGRVSPNPLVGAVIVRDGEVIGEGFHAELGRAACRARRDRGLPAPAARTRPARPSTSRSSPAPTRAASRPAPRRSSRPGSPASSTPRRTRPRRPPAAGRACFATAASRSSWPAAPEASRGPSAQPALPQASSDRTAPGHLQGGHVPRRPRRLAHRRLPLDLERREPRARPPLARRVRRRRGRDRHRARRRPAPHRQARGGCAPARPRRLRLARQAAARLRAGQLDRRGAADRDLRARGALRRSGTRWSAPAPR